MKANFKTLNIRFYEELNDFVSKDKRKKRFQHKFIDRTSVKDLIESLGVPHTEVDLILVNGNSVSFDYIINDKDDIAVYPVFESLDITNIQHLRKKPFRKPRFVCDVHLGKLARNLRMLGFDVFYENTLDDNNIVKIAMVEKRTILTRDVGILKRNEVTRGYFLRSTDPEEQTSEVLKRFDLYINIKLFSRCLECGNTLKNIAKKKIIDLIPETIKNTQTNFVICPTCKKIYWKGSHYQNMLSFIKKLQSPFTKFT